MSNIKNQELKLKEDMKRLFTERTSEFDTLINDLSYLK